ncbi:MAG: AAA family ATPase, partial [Candidatus Sungbacteria bacterium]|nr:AAA family ATPase [Candidatus Sungbacteria bacterium]
TQLDRLKIQTHGFGVFLRNSGDVVEIQGRNGEIIKVPMVDIRDMRGIEGRASVGEGIDVEKLSYGQRLVLLEASGPSPVLKALEGAEKFYTVGREASVVDMSGTDYEGMRVMVSLGDMQEHRMVHLAHCVAGDSIVPGSPVLLDNTGTLVIEVLPDKENSKYDMSEIPTVRFADIGGLGKIVGHIQEELLYSRLYPEVNKTLGLPYPRGWLFTGPPGVGKTMVAKAVVNYMADQIQQKTGEKSTGYFINIRGPELLTKWVGETEEKLRKIFEYAKKLATPVSPVIIFFDEMESIFPQRGSGISSDVEKTHVTMFTTLMDGMGERGNIIVIGATNREDLIDSAVTRPGRCDGIIRFHRPDAKGAREIFMKHLKPEWGQISPRYNVDVYVPVDRNAIPKKIHVDFGNDPQKVAEYLVDRAVERMYDKETPKNKFIEVPFQTNRGTEVTIFRFGDFASGAMIADIIERAKKLSRKEYIESDGASSLGVEMKHLYVAIESSFDEQRAPKVLHEFYNWLVMEGKADYPLAGPPMFCKHSESEEDHKEVF